MIRNKNPASMQKTYDECYLICSTAIYFEGQGNEAEALRSWRSALDRIYYHNAYRMPANYKPQTETERALQDSLRSMELQCKERVTLLEALRDSRKETEGEGSTDKKGKTLVSPKASDSKSKPESGWIGNGSVPAANHSDLAQPPLPPRTAPPPLRTPELSESSTPIGDLHKPLTPNPPPVVKPSSRSPSPEKKGRLKTTLRDGKNKKSKPKPPPPRPQAASKAAGLAWDYKRVPSSSSISKNNSHADPRESLSEHESGRQSSRDSPRQETHHLPPAPPPHIQPPYIAGGADLAGAPQRSERLVPVPRQPNSGSRPGPSHSDNEAARKRLPFEKPPPPQISYRNEYDPAPVSKASIAAAVNPPRGYEPDIPADEPKRFPPSDLTPPAIQRRPMKKDTPPRPNNPKAPAKVPSISSDSAEDQDRSRGARSKPNQKRQGRKKRSPGTGSSSPLTSDKEAEGSIESADWEERLKYVKKHLPKGIDKEAANQIFNEIVVQGDEVHWGDIAGLDSAKKALKEAVVYPFLRPDLFMGLREPARGMLLFGPPGTGKTMLARAVATESRSTFFSISASSLTSKWLGDSEKLVRALFGLARALAPSIIFVDEIDSLLGSRGGSSEHESTRRVKTEFLIQWSDLQRAAAGKEVSQDRKEAGDPTRVLVLAATNMPWAIDDAARRRFVRRQYIPLPERHVRAEQLRTLLGHQKHNLNAEDVEVIVRLTDGYSGSDMTALAKDAAMGPLRSLGEALLNMSSDEIRPIGFEDFEASLVNIRPSVSPAGLKEFEDWAQEFGERGG